MGTDAETDHLPGETPGGQGGGVRGVSDDYSESSSYFYLKKCFHTICIARLVSKYSGIPLHIVSQ